MLKALLTSALLILMAMGAAGQGVETGTIRGAVKDQHGLAVPGVILTDAGGFPF